MFFQRFLLARFIRKNVTAVKFSPQRYLKGITKWYCHRVPYITCHEGIKSSLQVAKATDSENEFEVLYIKLFIDGKEVLEIDKLNFICIFDGEDILKSVRDDLGL